MDGDQRRWPESYNLTGSYVSHVESGIEYDMDSSFLSTDVTDIMDFIHTPMPTSFLPEGPFSDTSYTRDLPYLPPRKMTTSQRQLTNHQLYVDTQLGSDQIDDAESSTASNSSLCKMPQRPYLQLSPGWQSPGHIFSPQSASGKGGILIPELAEMPSLLPSPLSQIASNFGADVFDAPAYRLPIEPDIVTQLPMPHILEWKGVIERCGTNDFIPQTVYQPYTEADRKRYIRDVVLQETIFFDSDDSSELGVSLNDALKQKLRHLKDKDDRMFIGCGPSVSIRVQWPGYAPWSKQIPTMDFKTPKGPITRAKLAKNIATCVRRFVEIVQDKPMEAESDGRWKIGKAHIRVEDLILVSLHHVSKGSWQPQLRLRRAFTIHGSQFFPQVSAT